MPEIVLESKLFYCHSSFLRPSGIWYRSDRDPWSVSTEVLFRWKSRNLPKTHFFKTVQFFWLLDPSNLSRFHLLPSPNFASLWYLFIKSRVIDRLFFSVKRTSTHCEGRLQSTRWNQLTDWADSSSRPGARALFTFWLLSSYRRHLFRRKPAWIFGGLGKN